MPEVAITVDIDAAQALGFLHNAEKRMAFALTNALNATAKEVQAAERRNVDARLTVRKADFIHREVATAYLARPGFGKLAQRLEARVRIGSDLNPKKNLLLSQYQEGGSRIGFLGGDVAIPVLGGARPQKTSGIAPNLTFSAMQLREYRPLGPYAIKRAKLTRKARGRHVRDFTPFGEYGRLQLPQPGGKTLWRGASRTYLIPGVGVFQRTGAGQTRLIWGFRPSVRIPASLHWLELAKAIAEARFQGHLREEVYKSLEYALQLRRFLG